MDGFDVKMRFKTKEMCTEVATLLTFVNVHYNSPEMNCFEIVCEDKPKPDSNRRTPTIVCRAAAGPRSSSKMIYLVASRLYGVFWLKTQEEV